MSDHILTLQLQQGPNLASINGYVENTHCWRVNVSADPHVVESQEDPFVQFNIMDWIRGRRNILLKNCDWTVGDDSPLNDTKKAEWQTYRQALRDVPANNSSASTRDDVVWPTQPS
jgi:hypothetical protein